MHKPLKNNAVIVLGMHRSGTSAVTGCLSLMGMHLGQNLIPADASNPMGYWEQNDVVIIHNNLLHQLGVSWSSVGELPTGWIDSRAARNAKKELLDVLCNNFSDTPWWALKDPRICRFVPLWLELLEELEVKPHFLLVFRRWDACANSLVKRDSIDRTQAHLLWWAYNRDMLRYTAGAKRSLINYESFLEHPILKLTAAARELSLPLKLDDPKVALRLQAFVDPSLNHTIAPADDNSQWGESASLTPLFEGEGLSTEVSNLLIEYVGKLEQRDQAHQRRVEKAILASRHLAGSTFLEVFFPRNGIYTPESCSSYLVSSGEWRHISIPVPQPVSLRKERLRIDPVQTKGMIWIAAIRLINSVSQEICWEWTPDRSGDLISISGTALKLSDPTNLLVLSTGDDPQLYLPAIDGLPDTPLEMQIWIKIDTSLVALQDYLIQMEKQQEQSRQDAQRQIEQAHLRAGQVQQNYEQDLVQCEVRIAQLGRDKENIVLQLSNIERKLLAMIESKSWKITRPLRIAEHMIRNTTKMLRCFRQLTCASPIRTLRNIHTFYVLNKSGLFDAEYYLDQNADIYLSHIDPLVHFILHGATERRDPNPYFNVSYYCACNAGLLSDCINPLLHYLRYGWIKGLDPSAEFSTSDYLEHNPDVREAGVNPLAHYYLHGRTEGRPANASRKTSQNRNFAVSATYDSVTMAEYVEQLFTQAGGKKGWNTEYVPFTANNGDVKPSDIKLIAFYLPQFHPIPENDEWWGKGFTEWTNVSKAVPQFLGHYQPHLPGELGFYDLRLPEVQARQIELAKKYGIYGFCYHYYYFGGKRLLERPITQLLRHPEWGLPFCLCWANENWTRRWDGLEQEILMAQKYSPDDDIAFIKDIEPALRDQRYIRVNNRPLLIVYRTVSLPDPKATAERWREYCVKSGIGDLYLVAARSFDISDPERYGFDGAVEFPPHQLGKNDITHKMKIINPNYKGRVYSYPDLVNAAIASDSPSRKLFKTVMPGWDNEARRPGKGFTFAFSNPADYSKWLTHACKVTQRDRPPEERFVFINAWNEWAEGAHLEPDRKFGYAFLHATSNVIQRFSKPHPKTLDLVSATQKNFRKTSETAVILHLYYEDLFEELADQYLCNIKHFDIFISIKKDINPERLEQILAKFPGACIFIFDNIGRDIYPFLQTFRFIFGHRYKYMCKIHTKKSPHRKDGNEWRTHILQCLLGDEDRISTFLNAFDEDASLGLICSDDSLTPLEKSEFIAGNLHNLKKLLGKLGGNLDSFRKFYFPSGSMFWFKPESLHLLLELGLTETDFEEETGQLDGSLAHAIERLFGYVPGLRGYRIIESKDLLADSHKIQTH